MDKSLGIRSKKQLHVIKAVVALETLMIALDKLTQFNLPDEVIDQAEFVLDSCKDLKLEIKEYITATR